ncbi:PREDICTED: ADP-ribose pyrophosphatase, mitochondrial-like [Acropora digitifera]|uniref:ADP-ribose pyrophosphatase, mitochondrial-like n=1 Tax=Acropora digitifera TaxID=70779 RepID=UPI00077AEAC6|nr:PREDICTED: ADP-ribose pyrophosphatase, mitochondrial-like [Acropora digitifera]
MIDTVNRLPRNPMGRTGLAGRGLLGRWGPNHTVHFILTRSEQQFQIYKGYLDDQRNTDNAWVETVAMNFHDETGKMLSSLDFEDEKGAPVVLWQELSGQIKLEAANWFLLYKVAQMWNAFY